MAARKAPEVEVVEPEVEVTVDDMLDGRDPYGLVRAKSALDGSEYTTSLVAALNAGSTVLDKPAVDQFGTFHPTKTVLDLRAETNPDAEAARPGDELPKEN